jgi:hypothetical protein
MSLWQLTAAITARAGMIAAVSARGLKSAFIFPILTDISRFFKDLDSV